MHLCIGPIVRLFTRALYQDIESRTSWYSSFVISIASRRELEFWSSNLRVKNGFTFKFHPTTTKVIFTYASDTGYGGFICEKLNKTVCVGKFSPPDQNTSSTFRESLAVKNVLQRFAHFLVGQSIQVNVDNQNASRIISVGSPKDRLQKVALDIFQIAIRNDIIVVPKWIPRDQNTLADNYSRLEDIGDWSIDSKTFCFINSRFGPFTVEY